MILVLGGTGFVGSHVCKLLGLAGRAYVAPPKSELDLENLDATMGAFHSIKPEAVINCAAFVGGIRYGTTRPVDLFDKNLRMSLNTLRAADKFGVKRLVNPIANCAYPARAELFREEEFWDGPLHESVMVYGFVRKAFWVGSWAYNRQGGLDVINLVLSNMYGPADHFHPERSHAMGALVKKIFDAKQSGVSEVPVWGSGKPVREWLYVEDGAEALVRGLDCPSEIGPVNVGIASGISIADLAAKIAAAIGFTGKLVFDPSQPDGAPYKTVEGSKGARLLGWTPQTPLDVGIIRTVEWYAEHRMAAA